MALFSPLLPMRLHLLALLLLVLALPSSAAHGGSTPPPPAPGDTSCGTPPAPLATDGRMNVLMIGDSISMGFGRRVTPDTLCESTVSLTLTDMQSLCIITTLITHHWLASHLISVAAPAHCAVGHATRFA